MFIRWWGGVNLPGAVIFLSLLGGLLVFGPLGFIAGPLSVSFFVAMTRLGARDLDSVPAGPLIALPHGADREDVNQ
jgi:predicted PurR-regulated permease PerM